MKGRLLFLVFWFFLRSNNGLPRKGKKNDKGNNVLTLQSLWPTAVDSGDTTARSQDREQMI